MDTLGKFCTSDMYPVTLPDGVCRAYGCKGFEVNGLSKSETMLKAVFLFMVTTLQAVGVK